MTTDQRLDKVEDKLDMMHTDLVEIKAGIRFATNAAKALGVIAGLVIAFLALH